MYAIDRVAEHVLVDEIERTIATRDAPVVFVAEGLPGGEVVVPEGADRAAARWVIIVDPIDGTRGLMYQKRPAWILTGVASGPGPRTLADIELAVQTEIPLVKQHLCDEVWAVRGRGASATPRQPAHRRESPSRSAAHRPPPPSRTASQRSRDSSRVVARELAAIDDEVVEALLGPPRPGKAQSFEDQYISTGGQLYELMAGHDRFRRRPATALRAAARRRRRALLSSVPISARSSSRASSGCW